MRAPALSCLALSFTVLAVTQPGASPAPASANSHPVYMALRSATLGDGHEVSELVLTRDAATFTLTGSVYLLTPVEGRTTGAVFVGSGTMEYTPPVASERAMLRALTKGEDFQETFERAVFRFTDDTASAIVAASTGFARPAPSQARNALEDVTHALRQRLRDNLHARLMHDVLPAAKAASSGPSSADASTRIAWSTRSIRRVSGPSRRRKCSSSAGPTIAAASSRRIISAGRTSRPGGPGQPPVRGSTSSTRRS